MSTESCSQCSKTAVNTVAILASLLVIAGLVAIMRHYTAIPSLSADRAAERMKILADFKAANEPLLEKYDWQDKDKGFVRVPVERAKEIILNDWKNSAEIRSNLMERAAKAFAPAPKAPPKKNEYE